MVEDASVICIDELPVFEVCCAGTDIVSAEWMAEVLERDSSVNP